MANLELTFKRRTFSVNIENVTELYISELLDYYEKSFNDVENESNNPDTFSNSFITGIRLVHEIKQLKEQLKRAEHQSLPDDTKISERIDAMISKINTVFNK